MPEAVTLNSFLGNARVIAVVRRAISQDRLPHAMIFAGPAGVGKSTFALLLARILNCLAPSAGDACGTCRSCKKILSGSHPDVREVNPDGAYIRIEQIRALSNEVAFQPFEGRYRVAVLDPADQMRLEGANSLLKTLEEPPSRTFIILITTNPYALLSTIRSRSRMLLFGGIPQREIESFLIAREERSAEESRLAAAFSNGSLGAALGFDAGRFRESRALALNFVRLTLSRGGFAEVSQLVAPLSKDKESFPTWMQAVGSVLEEVYCAQVAPNRLRQPELSEEIQTLARSTSHERVVSGIEAMKDLRFAVQHNVNRQIALEALYLRLSDDQ